LTGFVWLKLILEA